jgi:hypothetical protein
MSNKKDGLNYRCKKCYSDYRNKWYSSNKETNRNNARIRRQNLLPVVHKWIGDYLLAHPCVDCGNKDILVLEFDHVTGNKDFNIVEFARTHLNLNKVKAEVAKCEVRCVNCHRKMTNKRRSGTTIK